ncbi:CvpA family protein [Trichloromonas sp.]|uniref:CvpA family protein n=1 Tax=Trichloromonas sp. TaxID=3069249 RepID=UPI002A383B1A|nr:CvpA family protein [Trichloromonas sp.]
MNGVDIAILGILGAFLLKGLLRGLLKELCSLIGLLLGAFLAFRFHAPLAESLAQSFSLPLPACVIAAFLLVFLATVLLFAVLGYLLSKVVKLLFLGGFNRVAGGLFGLAQGALLLAVVLFGVSMIQLPGPMGRLLEHSELAPPFVQFGEKIFKGSVTVLDAHKGQPPATKDKTKI